MTIIDLLEFTPHLLRGRNDKKVNNRYFINKES